jgi:glycosyltransferase involved in cell wall biosynthesis
LQLLFNHPVSVSRRLRILHVTPTLAVGGAECMAGHLMIGLSRSHEVAAVGLYPPSNSPLENRLAQADIPRVHLNKRPGFDPRMFPALNRVLCEFQPDVVHTHLAALRYVFPVLLRRRVPVAVHTLHNLAEHETDTVGRMVNWLAFRRGVYPIGISREVAASTERVYGLKCRAVVPNCIPVEEYRRRPADRVHWRTVERFGPDDILFTCVGRLEPQKNPLMLLEAFAELNHPRSHLVLMGEGSLRESLVTCIRARRLERRVHLLGKRNNIPEVLAGSDVFVLSSNWEGNPLAVMEAMAAGLPVIGTAVGGVPELVQSGIHGLLVPPNNRAALASAMQSLLDDPGQRAALAAAACARAMTAFNLERMVQGYARVYDHLWEGSSPGVIRSSVTAA